MKQEVHNFLFSKLCIFTRYDKKIQLSVRLSKSLKFFKREIQIKLSKNVIKIYYFN